MGAQRVFIPLSFLLSFILLVLVVTTPSWARVQCGDVIGPNQVEVLTEDLTCDAVDTGGVDVPVLTLVGPKAVLHISGHTVTCDGIAFGIRLKGSGAILTGDLLKHGTVTGCRDGVEMGGDGHHVVRKVTARVNELRGFLLTSDYNEVKDTISQGNNRGYDFSGTNHNTLKGNLAKGGGNAGFVGFSANDTTVIGNQSIDNFNFGPGGFFIMGDRNHLIGNLAKNKEAGAGFSLLGNEVTVLWNKAIGNGGPGFSLNRGLEFTIVGNTAKRNGGEGIIMRESAENSTVFGNVALDNRSRDLSDDNEACDNNTWKFNWFGTANQDCIR